MKTVSRIILTAALAFAAAACERPDIQPEPAPEPAREAKPEVDAALWSQTVPVEILTDVQEEAYYKDVFMDGGISLTSRKRLPACEKYDISLEIFNGETISADSVAQAAVFVGSSVDHNGILLFPDGAPRFKMIYTCGGSSSTHGESMGEAGRNAIRKFNAAGGSYLGSCAGAFLAAARRSGDFIPQYYGIWPGNATPSGLTKSSTGIFIEPGSPLLKYFDYGGDMYVDSVRHNGGCYVTSLDIVPGTEILSRYDRSDKGMHLNGAVWAWKENIHVGRVISCGSHPEEVEDGERRDYFAAMLYYAMEGRGTAKVKKALGNGEIFKANKDSEDNDPLHAKIGDGQQHNFVAGIPKNARNIKVKLEYTGNYDICLLMNKGTFAFESIAQYRADSASGRKELSFDSLEEGTWYIGVHNNSRPKVEVGNHGLCQYTGQTELLNGISYTLTVSWE